MEVVMPERVMTPFGATTTAMEVVAGIDLGGKRAIVTGSASGIGVETARALAKAGAEVTLAVRAVEVGEAVAGEQRRSHGDIPAPTQRPGPRNAICYQSSWSLCISARPA